jgi:hypothetical protein
MVGETETVEGIARRLHSPWIIRCPFFHQEPCMVAVMTGVFIQGSTFSVKPDLMKVDGLS